MDIVRVRPMTLWAKNRKRQHGNLFLVQGPGQFRGQQAHLLGCVNGEWRGWFTEEDAVVELIDAVGKGRYN